MNITTISGSGYQPAFDTSDEWVMSCEICEGEGVCPVFVEDASGEDVFVGMHMCLECGGTGEIYYE